MGGNTQHMKRNPINPQITGQKSSIFDHCWYLFEPLALPGSQGDTKWIPETTF